MTKTKEFNLSDKQRYGCGNRVTKEDCWGKMVYWEQDVKEFIREVKEEIMIACDNKADGLLIHLIIDKLAGDKLNE